MASSNAAAKVKSLFSVEGKVVVITGGSSGIGLMLAHCYVANGSKVIICSRKGKVCEKVAKELNTMGPGTCTAIEANLSTEKACSSFAEKVTGITSRVDILVNNAGASWGEPFESYPDAAWDKLMALNVKCIFHLTRAMLPLLRAAGTKESPARVINIGSVDGIRVTQVEHYAYSASKAAVHMLTRTLAGKLASDNVTCNAIAAGPFPSKMTKGLFEMAGGSDVVGYTTALGRVGGPLDIFGISCWLSSRAGAWITGAIIPCDGGILLKSSM